MSIKDELFYYLQIGDVIKTDFQDGSYWRILSFDEDDKTFNVRKVKKFTAITNKDGQSVTEYAFSYTKPEQYEWFDINEVDVDETIEINGYIISGHEEEKTEMHDLLYKVVQLEERVNTLEHKIAELSPLPGLHTMLTSCAQNFEETIQNETQSKQMKIEISVDTQELNVHEHPSGTVWKNYGPLYTLCQVGNGEFKLISMSDGNRWEDTVLKGVHKEGLWSTTTDYENIYDYLVKQGWLYIGRLDKVNIEK